jgi:hypothetical protein
MFVFAAKREPGTFDSLLVPFIAGCFVSEMPVNLRITV